MISDSHPLRGFFSELVAQHFSSGVGIRDQEMAGYVANMLTEFCQMDQLLKICNACGRQTDDVGEMLLESDPVFGPAPSFDRERQVRKHIGDYTLFFAGMFPEAVNGRRLRRARLESLIDFVKAGKESYYIVSQFDVFEYKKVAPLFGRLSRQFESCVYGLNLVKNDLNERQHPLMRQAAHLIM